MRKIEKTILLKEGTLVLQIVQILMSLTFKKLIERVVAVADN